MLRPGIVGMGGCKVPRITAMHGIEYTEKERGSKGSRWFE